MKQKLKNIIVAIALWFFLPFAILNYIYCFKERFLAVGIIAIAITICIFSCSCSVDLNIIDITSAYNKGTHRTITTYIVIHHTAGEGATPAYIAKLHLSKWSSIGYHYFIDTNGTVYNLRYDDESEVPHALGFNDCCVAICISGNFSNYECPDKLWEIALELTRQMMKKYNVDKEHVIGHRELPHQRNTECPGLKFDMNKFREDL